jgi:type II secretory ATPase GspE/PulE/Tfp pilus assembly ATPase PilB-like protein
MERKSVWLGTAMVGEDEKRRAEALRLGVPFVTLDKNDISVASLVFIPEPLSRTRNIIAYRHSEHGIEVALLDLADLPAIDFLRKQYRVEVRLTDRGSLKQALVLYQKHLKEKFAGMVRGGKEAAESLLRHALHSGAQYVHIEPAHAEAASMVVRYRIEGALKEALRLPTHAGVYIVEQLKHLGKLFPVSTAVQEGSFTFTHDEEEVAVALIAVPTASGEKVTMRLARQKVGAVGFSLQSLGLHGDALERMHDVLHAQTGVVLVAGHVGSGKTTLLYTLLDHVGGPHASVATVENQIEYKLPQVHQAVTRPELGLTSQALLRSVLKQDPDTVMVSDITEDTTELVMSAAERGVFILGGVEAGSAAEGLATIMGGEVPDLLAVTTVKAVISQRVLHKLCPHAHSRSLGRSEGEVLEGKVRFSKVLSVLKQEGVIHEHIAWKDVSFYTASPCKECAGISEEAASYYPSYCPNAHNRLELRKYPRLCA